MTSEERWGIVVENIDYARKRARKYLGRGLTLDELVSAAIIGMYLATEKYDPTRGVQFKTYADRQMRGMMCLEFAHLRNVRLPEKWVHGYFDVSLNDEMALPEGGTVEAIDFVEEKSPDPLSAFATKDLLNKIEDAINELPEIYQGALIEYLDADNGQGAEVARVLGISRTAARSRVSRGRRILQNRLRCLCEQS